MDVSGLQFTPLLMPILGAAVLLTFLAVYAWRQSKTTSGTGVFLALLVLSAWWCYTYALELITTDPTIMLLWVKLEWISIALLPVAWLLFALLYAEYPHRVTIRTAILLSVLPAITIVLVWTTPAHALIYENLGVQDVGNFVAFSAERGPAFYVHVAYSYLLILVATALIVRVWWRATGPQRQLAAIVAGGALLPIFGNAVYQVALAAGLPLYFDLTVPAFAFSAVLFAWGWFRLRLFELVPELGGPLPGTGDVDPAIAAQNTRERTVNLVSLGLSGLLFLALAPILTILLRAEPPELLLSAAYIVLYLIILSVAIWRHGSYIPRAVALTSAFLALALLDLRMSGLSPVAGFYLVAFTAFATLLVPRRLALGVLAAGILALILVPPAEFPQFERDAYSLGYLILSAAMTGGLLSAALAATRRDIRTLLETSRDLSRQLETEREELEFRVSLRTRALETSAIISRQLSTILDQSPLVREVVEQLRVAFAYYHVHVYLYDEDTGVLRMVGGTGEAGQAMLVAGHSLRPDQGLVGRAYSTSAPVVVPDVSKSADWLPNRLLPGTQAEIAVPITYANEVLGVLDVQDEQVGGLGDEDSQLLQTIAGQMAVTLRNARLLAQIRREAEQAELINAINSKIVQTTDFDAAMRVALAELSRALETRQAAVHLEIDGENGHDH